MKKIYTTLVVVFATVQISNAQLLGTTNYIPKFTSATTAGNSLMYDNGTGIGIGTNTPGKTLDVIGIIKSTSLNVKGSTSAEVNAVTGTGMGYDPITYPVSALGVLSGNGVTSIGYNPLTNTGGAFTGDGSEVLLRNIVKFVQPNASGTNFLSPALTMNNGNIGIGTANPDRLLVVSGTNGGGAGDNAFHGTIRLDDATALAADNGAGVAFGYTYTGTNQTYGPFIRGYKSTATDNEVGGGLKLGVRGDSGNPFTAITIDKMGNVGIGTSTPHEALSVNGNIRSKQVKVEINNWPDYVFKPSYALPSLSEVKTYINKYQHLPEMPSGTEVAEDGLNLGEINKLLTKKVEELTLYLIEEHKKNDDQQEQLNELKQQMAAISKTLNKS